ncbi:hypothetical protein GCM10009765_05400 [Fodinicola feengrottensis]|uniref:Uncharacterized protein n=1 Tax=Fodinicola feengrottensis TaxID=435914 RepID=A0ABN2FT98_9ACTN
MSARSDTSICHFPLPANVRDAMEHRSTHATWNPAGRDTPWASAGTVVQTVVGTLAAGALIGSVRTS